MHKSFLYDKINRNDFIDISIKNLKQYFNYFNDFLERVQSLDYPVTPVKITVQMIETYFDYCKSKNEYTKDVDKTERFKYENKIKK